MIISMMPIGYVYNDNEESEIYTFNSANGKLTSIESALDNSSITVQYVNLFPVTFHHSNGKRMNVTYTDEGLINSVDILGRNEEIESTRYSAWRLFCVVYKIISIIAIDAVSTHMMTLIAY